MELWKTGMACLFWPKATFNLGQCWGVFGGGGGPISPCWMWPKMGVLPRIVHSPLHTFTLRAHRNSQALTSADPHCSVKEGGLSPLLSANNEHDGWGRGHLYSQQSVGLHSILCLLPPSLFLLLLPKLMVSDSVAFACGPVQAHELGVSHCVCKSSAILSIYLLNDYLGFFVFCFAM